MNKKALLLLVALGLPVAANAGLDWTTVHSRANCLNNESITWWYLHPYEWRVMSIHKYRNTMHSIDSGFSWTWRAHAIHWGEGNPAGDWEVWGYHYLRDFSAYIPFDNTYAKTCNIIDGW